MSAERLHDFIQIGKDEASALFAQFDKKLSILDFSLIGDSMSNTGYVVATDLGKYLLKLYSNTTDKIEAASYRFLKDKINVPELYYYDGSKQRFPFAYTITEFLEGETFIHYVRTQRKYPPEMARMIGAMCAQIHSRKYEYDAMLDESLNILDRLPSTQEKMLHLLSGKPGTHLKSDTVTQLRGFIGDHKDLFGKIEAESVFSHGDFGYNNMMICKNKVYCIDFEFAYSGSIYNDIGRFFRRKDPDVQSLLDLSIYESFAQGYHSISMNALPADWLTLARVCDINAMLCLLSYDTVPAEWINDIEFDILRAISQTNKQ